MDLDDFIITVFCVIDEAIPVVLEGQRLRERGPAPSLADSEVVTMEIVGEYLGLERESALFAYFRHHSVHFFPALRSLHRTTFTRQAANLWRLKERLWQQMAAQIPHAEQFALVASFALPVCQFARAYRCQRFRGAAAYGKDHLTRQTFYGFRVHVRLAWPGRITRIGLAPANVSELAAVPALAEATTGWLVGDRNYWQPHLTDEVAAHGVAAHGVALVAPFRWARRDPHPGRATRRARLRYRIDTVFGQLVERCAIKRVWAQDVWHLSSRLLRQVLMHTLAVLLNVGLGTPPLQLARVVAS
jgi:Transposase DDE domain